MTQLTDAALMFLFEIIFFNIYQDLTCVRYIHHIAFCFLCSQPQKALVPDVPLNLPLIHT